MRVVVDMKHILPLAVLFICGCTSPNFESWNESVFSLNYWNITTAEQQANKSQQQIKQALVQGDIEQAQRDLLDSRRESVSELFLSDLYTEVTNLLLHSADEARIIDRPERAGRLFRLAHEIYPIDPHLQSTINLTLDEIDTEIEQCADRLMLNGLIAYRAGELDIAIHIWQRISRFHPNHQPSLVATNTARQQLKRLELITEESVL